MTNPPEFNSRAFLSTVLSSLREFERQFTEALDHPANKGSSSLKNDIKGVRKHISRIEKELRQATED